MRNLRASLLAVAFALSTAAFASVVVTGCSGSTVGSFFAPSIKQAPPVKPLAQPIQRVFIICLENHTFDNFFASYPGALDSPVTSGLGHDGRVIPLRVPDQDRWSPGSNDWDTAHADWNGGLMNGFDNGSHQPPSSLSPLPVQLTLSNMHPLRADGPDGAYVSYAVTPQVAQTQVPELWGLAQRGVLCDRYFTSLMGPSLPNHFYLYAATSGGAISNPDALTGQITILDPTTGQRRKESSIPPSLIATTLPNELEQKGLSWTILQELADVPYNDIFTGTGIDVERDNNKIDVMTHLPDWSQRYITTPILDQRLPEYLAKGWGSHVTWIKPNLQNSGHPIISEVSISQSWLHRILDAIGGSQDWAHCAVFITWDDYGGFYDHVPPPQLDAFGLGMRVPCLVIGPYAKKGVVDHTTLEHSSILKFCETVYGLPAMTNRDAQSADFSEAFDFEQAPRPYSDFVPAGAAP